MIQTTENSPCSSVNSVNLWASCTGLLSITEYIQAHTNRLNFRFNEICYVHNFQSLILLQDGPQMKKKKKQNSEVPQWTSFYCYIPILAKAVSYIFTREIRIIPWCIEFYFFHCFQFYFAGSDCLISYLFYFSLHLAQSHSQLLCQDYEHHLTMIMHRSNPLAPFSPWSWCSRV